jgi:hypothetical protein
MGLTTRRAVCRSCLERDRRPADAWRMRHIAWAGAAVLGVLAVIVCVFFAA